MAIETVHNLVTSKGRRIAAKCGCDFETATSERGVCIHNPDMKDEDWICHKCDDPEAFEFEQKVKKLLEKNGLFLKCPGCGEKMKMVFSYMCECGTER